MKRSPSRRASICKPARSEPALGSEKPWHQISSALRIFGIYRFFCASVPQAMMVGPMRPKPSELAMGGASTRAISSQNRACCISVALRPPYSLGHETAAQRPSWSFCCQARRYGNDSSMGFARHSCQAFGTLDASHSRSSSRNACSSAVKLRSMKKTPSLRRSQTTPPLFSSLKRISLNQAASGADEVRANRVLILPVLFAQILFQNLTSPRLWQALTKFDGMRTFVMRQARTAEFHQLALACTCPGFKHHERHGHLAPLFVRHGDHRNLQNRRMGNDSLFHFER